MITYREALIARVQTDLQAINGTAPFTTTVQLVSRTIVSLAMFLSRAGLPGIAIVDKGDEPFFPVGNQTREYHLNLLLVLYLEAQPGTEGTDLNSFIGDALYAMTAPTYRTHGGLCLHTEHMGTDPLLVEGERVVGATMDFKLLFGNTWTLP